MKRTKIIYWVATVIICLLMLIGGFSLLFSSANREALRVLGFPDWFRIELGIAKIIGVLALFVPGVPSTVKQWAYAGFATILVSAALAHFNSGDPYWKVIDPLGFLVVLGLSNLYFHKLQEA